MIFVLQHRLCGHLCFCPPGPGSDGYLDAGADSGGQVKGQNQNHPTEATKSHDDAQGNTLPLCQVVKPRLLCAADRRDALMLLESWLMFKTHRYLLAQMLAEV